MAALLAEIQTANPPDPEQVGLPMAAVQTPQGTLAQKLTDAPTPLSGIRATLN